MTTIISEMKLSSFFIPQNIGRRKLNECRQIFISGTTESAKARRLITDGECRLPGDFLPVIRKFKAEGMKLTGILFDRGENFEFLLREFADMIYRTSELIEDSIVEYIRFSLLH